MNYGANAHGSNSWRSQGQHQYRQRQPKIAKQNYDYFLVLDFEATCEKDKQIEPQEIIEFPVLKVSAKTFEVESTFVQFVKPIHNPQLSEFCKQLTTIKQEEVDSGKQFTEVLKDFDQWMENDVGKDKRIIFVTCGHWDLRHMLPKQCELSNVPVPLYFGRWINIKKPYQNLFKDGSRSNDGSRPCGMMQMIEGLNLEHVGTHHRGIDDCRNIANILRAIAERGWIFQPADGKR